MPVKAFMEYIEMMDTFILSSTTNLEGKITSASKAFCKLTGYELEELIGKSHGILRAPDTPEETYEELWRDIRSGLTWQGEIKNLRKDGSCFWVYAHIKPNYDLLGQITGFTAVRQDITDHKRVQQMLLIDELTQAYNRRHFNQVLHPKLDLARLKNRWLGFLMIDADHFKKYNDTYGHQMGDEALKSISQSLKDSFKPLGGTVFRLGGEEFCVLFDAEFPETLIAEADKARIALQDLKIEHSGNPPSNILTVSMGLMTLDPQKDYIVEEIYKYADIALYKAKQAGRNVVKVVDEDNTDDFELF